MAESSGYWFEDADRHAERLAAELMDSKTDKYDLKSVTVRAKVRDYTTVVAAAVFI